MRARFERMKKQTMIKRHNFTLFFKPTDQTLEKEEKQRKHNNKRLSCSRALLCIKNENCHAQHITHLLAAANQSMFILFYSMSEIRFSSSFPFLFAFYFSPVILFHHPTDSDRDRKMFLCVCTNVLSDDNKKSEKEIRQKCRHECE